MASLDSEVVDINVYAMELIKETCPTMDESKMLQVAKDLIEEATLEVNKREKQRRQLNRRVKLAARKCGQSAKCERQNIIPTMATNNTTLHIGNGRTNFHCTKNFRNHREINFGRYGHAIRQGNFPVTYQTANFPPFYSYNQNPYGNCGMMRYNNFNKIDNCRSGPYKPLPTYRYPKRKNETPHGSLGIKRTKS